MGFFGLLDLPVWQLILVVLALTHVTIVSVTIYLHRHSAHNAVDLHPALAHFFRFWLWLTTGTVTKEWTAIHRKHHATCETENDPHSPVVLGINKVMWEGAELYQAAATPETLERFGQRTPEDWVERNVYTRHRNVGIMLMAAINLALFGVHGIWMWAVQMIWIPFFAAGVINGLGHFFGYRNFECSDNAHNIVPWGILVGGEELHNNHHSYPNSAKLSRRWYELDMGWVWIRLFQMLGLAHPKGIKPIAFLSPGKKQIDMDTIHAIANNRLQIMRQYRKRVLEPVFRQQRKLVEDEFKPLYRKAGKLLSRDEGLLRPRDRQSIEAVLNESATARLLHEKSLELQRIWARRSGLRPQEKIQALLDWCHHAEQSGVQYLEEFAATLRSYTLRPTN
ncbi:MAG: acyl-CoA desaturase [Halomonadaceae bacterium]|nr:MAG: acyl-CoA desaturase [Halomonadaceae bacterium]